METQAIPTHPINAQIFDLLENIALQQVEDMASTQEIMHHRNELIDAIESKVSPEIAGQLSDEFVLMAIHFGREMLRIGLTVGREPGLLLDLPSDPW